MTVNRDGADRGGSEAATGFESVTSNREVIFGFNGEFPTVMLFDWQAEEVPSGNSSAIGGSLCVGGAGMVTSEAVNRENVVSVAKGVLESLSEPKWPASEPTGRKSSRLVAGEYRAPYSMGADEGEPEDASASSSGGLSSTERFSILTGFALCR